MYGVETVAGKPTCCSRALSSSFMRMKLALDLPCVSTRELKESIHSEVSSESMSGKAWEKPSKITSLVNHAWRRRATWSELVYL